MSELVRVIPVEDWWPSILVRHRGTLMVLEHGEYCCVCKTTDNLIAMELPTGDEPLKFTFCKDCEGDKFTAWLANDLEKCLASQPDKWRKNPDGTWHPLDQPEQTE